jgi:2,3-bisphosphoglycerate-independent phosphoglycerate mutase
VYINEHGRFPPLEWAYCCCDPILPRRQDGRDTLAQNRAFVEPDAIISQVILGIITKKPKNKPFRGFLSRVILDTRVPILYTPSMAYKPVVLIIVDGFGVAPSADGNAVNEAKMPIFHRLVESYPAMTLQASGSAVGLGWGEMGNSEVGHLTIGAGRIFYQSLPRINLAIESGEFASNPALQKTIDHAKTNNGAIHLLGLVSPGGVHATTEHLHALLDLCKKAGITRVYVHAFLDGRDTQYRSALGFIDELEAKMKEMGIGEIASLSGRFYAMDRDNRWDRVQKTYEAIAAGRGEMSESAHAAIEASYAKGVYDEQFVPTVITKQNKPIGLMTPGDGVIFFNFRPDRMRQITKAFCLPTFTKFERQTYLTRMFYTTMTEYEKDLPVEVAFPPYIIEQCLARVVSEAGLRQLHIAETEKYAHVTFFLNGMREEAFPGEERVIVPSPRVSSYDQAPEMSIFEVTDRIVKEISAASYDLIVVNFANPDMVGHTGDEAATIKACEAVDKALGQIVDAILLVGGAVLLTADHGNAEEVKNLVTGEMDKEHSTNPVPCLIVAKDLEGMKAPGGDVVGGDLSFTPPVGMLADVAPTVCKLLGIPQGSDMTGQALV